jgi:hypothetical protein
MKISNSHRSREHEKDLARQDIRRLIERLLITLYRSQGLDLLNL